MVEETSLGGSGAAFAETAWSTVLRAKDDGAALGRLIDRTWKPLYFYLRRKGRDVEAAKDLTQSFFSHLLERRLIDRVERGRGRFRGFLLAALEHFLANEYRVATAEKRGGTSVPLSLDFGEAESQYAPALAETAESLYARSWAISVLQGALADLGAELGDRFDLLRRQEHLLASTDKKSWMPLSFHFFPLFRYSKVTVSTKGLNFEVVVPVTTSFEELSITRDLLGGLGPR